MTEGNKSRLKAAVTLVAKTVVPPDSDHYKQYYKRYGADVWIVYVFVLFCVVCHLHVRYVLWFVGLILPYHHSEHALAHT